MRWLAIFSVLFVAGCSSDPVKISAEALYKDYQRDPSWADGKYKGKLVEVEGYLCRPRDETWMAVCLGDYDAALANEQELTKKLFDAAESLEEKLYLYDQLSALRQEDLVTQYVVCNGNFDGETFQRGAGVTIRGTCKGLRPGKGFVDVVDCVIVEHNTHSMPW